MRAKQSLLLHPHFLVSLALLLLNDFYFKYEYHNWFTGKISDFTGLFVFAVFLIVFFPSHKKMVCILCGLFFCWWKSPLSNSFIDFFNYINIPLNRVIDYTDLLALSVLPFVYKIKEPDYPVTTLRFVAVYTMGTIALFSFCATSMPRHLMYDYDRENEVTYYETFSTSLNEQEILEKLNPRNDTIRKESLKFYPLRNTNNFYYKIKKDSTVYWAPIANNKDSALFAKETVSEFYSIPQYLINGDTLKNLELRIYHNSRKRKKPYTVELISFQTNKPADYKYFYQSKKKRQYKKHFKALFQ